MTCSLVRGGGCSSSDLSSRLLSEEDVHDITGATLSKIRRKENKSTCKYELLEDKMNSNFGDFGSKLDQISSNGQNCTKYVKNVLKRNRHKDVLIIRRFKV